VSILIILNKTPYDGTDNIWNSLRLAKNLLEKKVEVNIFLMNDAVDLAKDACRKPADYEHDLVIELKRIVNSGASLKVCGNCQTRSGKLKDESYYDASIKSTMFELSEWVINSDKVLDF